MAYRLITDSSGLKKASNHIRAQSRIALDCEAAGFHRYTDRLCLVQLSTSEATFLFDPLAADPADTLRPALEDSQVQVVMHGADFDLKLLHRDLGIRLRGLFDTQVAATLLGASSIGLAALLQERLGVSLSKEHQRADWAKRPLADELLRYAASDTEHLLALANVLDRELTEKGRRDWAAEEFRALESIEWVEDQADPVTRVKGARYLEPRPLTTLRALLAWRDRIARKRDRAPFRVIGDQALLAVAAESPSTVEALAAIQGVSPRLAKAHGEALLRELARIGKLAEADLEPYPRGNRDGQGRLSPEDEQLVENIRALRERRADELELDKGILLSNAQIQEIVRAYPRSMGALLSLPSVKGWQAGILGSEILKILEKRG
ncbi:MAG: HRDC domain-containing protein [Gemmatimonadota bacterium]|jgi:ribonuclease D